MPTRSGLTAVNSNFEMTVCWTLPSLDPKIDGGTNRTLTWPPSRPHMGLG